MYTVFSDKFLLGRQMGRSCSSSSRQTGDCFGEIILHPQDIGLVPAEELVSVSPGAEGRCKCVSQKERSLKFGEVLISPRRRSGGKREVQTGERTPSDYDTLLPSQDSHLPRALPGCLIWPEFFSAQNVNTQQFQTIVLRLRTVLANFLLLI